MCETGKYKMNKKIGIATFHYADNFGAILQAYALRKTINDFNNCEAEIINYVPDDYCYRAYSKKEYDELTNKRSKIENFLRKECGINSRMINEISGNKYDYYISGSDQVWNMDIPEAGYSAEYLFPHLERNAVKVAYAASIGMEIERIDKVLFKKYLCGFSSISVREKSYMDVISELSGKRCICTLDPTLLLEKEDYENLINENCMADEEDYLLFFWYGIDDNDLDIVEFVNAVARKNNLKIHHTLNNDYLISKRILANKGRCVINCGIEEFLAYIKHAKMVITDSYHCMLLALIFDKSIYVLPSKGRSKRQTDFLETFDLSDLLIDSYNNHNICKMDHNRNFASLIKTEKEKSIMYLKDSLEVES